MLGTYRRLLFSVLAPGGLCAQVGPDAAVSAAIHPSADRGLRVECGDLGLSSQQAGRCGFRVG